MSKLPATAVFDIGKTNKKFFVFDEQLQEVHRDYITFEESTDEDGFPCDQLDLLRHWIQDRLAFVLAHPTFDVQQLNVSTYGASMVHVDAEGAPLTPLYNYLKPYPEELLQRFYELAGGQTAWETRTASPTLGMLNSGLQLYWLKHCRPAVFERIHQSLHLPQYCAYLLSGQFASDYTSIGCHTGLWNFSEEDYDAWVDATRLRPLLAPLYPTTHTFPIGLNGKLVKVGVGIHDSSSALLPYLQQETEPFLLLSTGTWSICLNPFNHELLTPEELRADCLHYLSPQGTPVKAGRLFLGQEYKERVQQFAAHFQASPRYHKTIAFDEALFQRIQAAFPYPTFKWQHIQSSLAKVEGLAATELSTFPDYETAFHVLMRDMVELQVAMIRLLQGPEDVRKVFLDGGFIDNAPFVGMLRAYLPTYEFVPSAMPLGSALGAALAVQAS